MENVAKFISYLFSCRLKDDDSSFEVSLDTHDYRPDELKVSVEGGTLTVEAKHEEKGEGKFVSR